MPLPATLTEIRPGLLAQRQPTSMGTVDATLCYVILGDGDVTLVDPGEDHDRNWELLRESLAALGRSPDEVSAVLVTHLHADHLGMAERVRTASGAEIAMHRVEQLAVTSHYGDASAARFEHWGVPDDRRPELEAVVAARAGRPIVRADRLLDDADVVRLGDREATVLWTPGHTTGSICLDLPGEEIVLTGDHLLPTMHPGIGLGGMSPGNPLREYLASLARVEALGPRLGLPGHGHPFPDTAARCRETAAHHARRGAEVATALDRMQRPSVWELASQLRWSGGWAALRGYALDSALAQTEMHVELLGRASELDRA
jgi:glyoxylase-like metal-dependent hydrolase (beta-lactamase superfamily II)